MDLSPDFVWVAARVVDGGGSIREYRGRMDVDVFRQITMNELTTGWFALESVIWERDREDVPQNVVGENWGYGDVTYFRIENLIRIILLSDAFVRKLHPSE
jgi:hypothetical protein